MVAKHLQTLANQDASIHPVLITWTESSWANRVTSPDSNAAFMTEFWLN